MKAPDRRQIISASYRTDIPAFYGTWFAHRLAAGRCRVRNPYNGRTGEVRLDPDRAAGFVFWTRNARPFLPVLAHLADTDRPFYLTYSILGYPRSLDRSVPAIGDAVATVRILADRFGRDAVVWRYDPVLFTDGCTADWHRTRFAALADRLAPYVTEVSIAFAHLYRKSRRNLADGGISWRDPGDDEKMSLLADFRDIAQSNGLRIALCAQREWLIPGVHDTRCIDPERLSRIAGRAIEAENKPHRPTCGCAHSRDIGAYDSCPHGCLYCYAVGNPALAARRLKAHDPALETL